MAYSKIVFGQTENQQQALLYTVVNENGVEASFSTLGATWVSMMVPDRDGTMQDVILGYDNPVNYQKDTASFGAVVGRNANRIASACFVLNGVEYRLESNDGSNNLHSGLDFYKNRIWEAEVEETDLGTCIVFSLLSPDGDQGYPGTARIEVRYTLTADNSVMIEYDMICDADTIANLTNHCYFNLGGHQSGTILDQKVWIHADTFTPADSQSIPTGEVLPVKGTPMDFTELKAIGAEIDADYQQLVFGKGYDHNWILNDYNKEVRLSAKAVNEKNGIILEVYTDLPGLQFYTGNFLNHAMPGKDHANYDYRAGYCFETQYFPDAIHHPNFPSPVLKAGKEYRTTTIYTFKQDL